MVESHSQTFDQIYLLRVSVIQWYILSMNSPTFVKRQWNYLYKNTFHCTIQLLIRKSQKQSLNVLMLGLISHPKKIKILLTNLYFLAVTPDTHRHYYENRTNDYILAPYLHKFNNRIIDEVVPVVMATNHSGLKP